MATGNQRSISITGGLYERLRAYCNATGDRMGRVVERVLAGDLATPDRPLAVEPATVQLEVSRELRELLDDHVERHGGTPAAHLDAAIQRMLDAADAVLANAKYCAICSRPRFPLRVQPAEHGYIAICEPCDGEHPRMGRYSFGDPGSGLGAGNRQTRRPS